MKLVSPTSVILIAAAALVLPTAPAGAQSQPAQAAAPSCKGRPVTILGTDEAEQLRGTNKRDVILALGGDDRVDGRGGNDVICGGSGRDLIKGGPGQDKIFGGADGRAQVLSPDGQRLMVGDVVQGGPGDDLIDLGFDPRQLEFGSFKRDRLSYKGSAFRVQVTLGGPDGRGRSRGDGRDAIVPHAFLALLGSDRGDVLTGSPYGDEILGRAGADLMDGGGGRDALVDGPIGAREGDDVLVGGIGRDTLTSYGGRDRLAGDAAADELTAPHAPLGKLTLQGGLGSDILTVGGLRSGACVNAVGGGGADELLPSVATEARQARVDIDIQRGEFGVRVRQAVCGFVASVEDLTMVNQFTGADGPRWHVRGTGADETVLLRMGASIWASMAGGDDRVSGNSGDDNLRGGPGDDRLFGGGGHNIANGGDGTDTCRKVAFKKQCELPAG